MQEFWLGAGVNGFNIDSANLLVVNLEANAPDKEKIKVKKKKKISGPDPDPPELYCPPDPDLYCPPDPDPSLISS